MAFDPSQIRMIERRRYVLDHAPSILCALIARRASTDPEHLIELAITTASGLFDLIDPVRKPMVVSNDHHMHHHNGTA